MLKELYVENLAVIEKMNITFASGLTVFTGETGAGKSILIDAINLVLGQRASKDIVRTGTSKAVVSAVFGGLTAEFRRKLEGFGYESEDGEIMVAREISADGKSTARLMGRPVTVAVLRELGTMLINIHGQHDSQILLSEENHIDILDSYAGAQVLYSTYRKEYERFSRLKSEYQKLNVDEQEKARRIDLLSYQVDEIAQAEAKPGEDEQVESRLGIIRNAAKIAESLNAVYVLLRGYEDDGGVYDSLSRSCDLLEDVAEYHQTLGAFSEELSGKKYEIEEFADKLSAFLDRFDYNAGELEELEERLNELNQLKRKYGATLEEVLEYYDSAKKELETIQLSEQTQAGLLEQMDHQKQRVVKAGQRLSEARRKAGKEFVSGVSKQLAFLDMPNIAMDVRIEKTKYGAKGCDVVEILFSTNKGEALKSISKIASGGELSRIMLAIKSVLAEKDAIDTLIFDEIDTGVSGKSAQKIGLKLREVAAHRQVLCVTHSAQIAALAENNFLIRKSTKYDRTFTSIHSLDDGQKEREVARIMSTGEITDLMLENAKEMISQGKNLTGEKYS